MPRSTPPIPPILDGELLEAVSSLVRAADSYRRVLFSVAQNNPDAFAAIMKHEDLLHLSDAVINAWRNQLGHDVEGVEE